jgi:hypothetical protein
VIRRSRGPSSYLANAIDGLTHNRAELAEKIGEENEVLIRVVFRSPAERDGKWDV